MSGLLKKAKKAKDRSGLTRDELKSTAEITKRLILQYRQKFAADREKYGRSLLATYLKQSEILDSAAERILSEGVFEFGKMYLGFLNLYDFITIAIYAPLADNLTYDEEDALRELSTKVQASWKKLMGAISLRRANLTAYSMTVLQFALEAQDILDDLYLGEIVTELPPRYHALMSEIMKFFRPFIIKEAK